ncbi:MAG: hypothetical protein KGO50_19370 [Myxococcales bacterium]|nr:hypothetical protein [Myxococcales bacterium]
MPNWNGATDWQNTVPIGKPPIAHIGWSPGLQSGVWVPAPSIFRLRLVGTGSAVVVSRDRLGAESSVDTYTATSATNQIEFPFLGDAATEMQVTFPSTLTVEVLP